MNVLVINKLHSCLINAEPYDIISNNLAHPSALHRTLYVFVYNSDVMCSSTGI